MSSITSKVIETKSFEAVDGEIFEMYHTALSHSVDLNGGSELPILHMAFTCTDGTVFKYKSSDKPDPDVNGIIMQVSRVRQKAYEYQLTIDKKARAKTYCEYLFGLLNNLRDPQEYASVLEHEKNKNEFYNETKKYLRFEDDGR